MSVKAAQRSVRIWEKKRAERLETWLRSTKKYPKTDPRRKKAWANYRTGDRKLREAKAHLVDAIAKQPRPSKRQQAVAHAATFGGKVNENPPGSNRGGIITEWQRKLGSYLIGQPWCGTFAANMLLFVGVKGVSGRLASVELIEQDAKTGRAPFKRWVLSQDAVRPGDLVVLFGRGVHVGMVDHIKGGMVYTIEGNTSSGTFGSQSNGGGVYRRSRPPSQVRGYALVRYPGE